MARNLVKLLSGSRLYGTNNDQSDYDYKVLVLPSLEDLLRNKKQANYKKRPDGLHATDKMLPGEDEHEFLPIHTFFDDFYAGQTYAFEAVFAVLSNAEGIAEYEDPADEVYVKSLMMELKSNFLHSGIKKMVAYAVNQAQIYGVKTERFQAIKTVYDTTLEFVSSPRDAGDGARTQHRLRDYPMFLQRLLMLPYVKWEASCEENGNQDMVQVGVKRYPTSSRFDYFLINLEKTMKEYGARVKTAKDANDWKALMHAMRIAHQVLSLQKHGSFSFPAPNAEYLREVRAGKFSIERVLSEFQSLLNEIEQTSHVLPARDEEMDRKYEEWKLNWLTSFYQREAAELFKLQVAF